MDALSLLASLAARGHRLEVRAGGRLFVSPTLGLTPEDRAALKAHKPALFALLAGEESYTPLSPSSAEESCSIPNLCWPESGFAWRYAHSHQCADAQPPPGPIAVPADAVLIYQDARPRPCERAQAVLWTWLGGSGWYSLALNPPAFEGEEARSI